MDRSSGRGEKEMAAVGRLDCWIEGQNPEGKGRALSFRESESVANLARELRQREEGSAAAASHIT